MYILNSLGSFCWKREGETGLKRLSNGTAFLLRPKKWQVVVKNGSWSDLG